MSCILAIGGGSISSGDTLPLDREIVNETGKDNPEALFIPTASEDSEEYIEAFDEVYGEELGCETHVLKLTKENYSEEEIKERIESADLIYVGGGNTRGMMEIWRDKGVDRLLKEAYRNGTVMSGLSAGAICWFEYGHSDSERYEQDGEWNFIQVGGLNIVENVIYCPHYHSEDREAPFEEMMRENPEKTGIAVDDNAAVKVMDEKIKILKSKKDAKAYTGEMVEGDFELHELSEGETYPIENL